LIEAHVDDSMQTDGSPPQHAHYACIRTLYRAVYSRLTWALLIASLCASSIAVLAAAVARSARAAHRQQQSRDIKRTSQ
jgi:hypothetical protein